MNCAILCRVFIDMLQTWLKNSLPKKYPAKFPETPPEKFQGPIAVGMGPQKADKIQVFLFVRFRALQLWKTEREFCRLDFYIFTLQGTRKHIPPGEKEKALTQKCRDPIVLDMLVAMMEVVNKTWANYSDSKWWSPQIGGWRFSRDSPAKCRLALICPRIFLSRRPVPLKGCPRIFLDGRFEKTWVITSGCSVTWMHHGKV